MASPRPLLWVCPHFGAGVGAFPIFLSLALPVTARPRHPFPAHINLLHIGKFFVKSYGDSLGILVGLDLDWIPLLSSSAASPIAFVPRPIDADGRHGA
jgi:hypothetical protein